MAYTQENVNNEFDFYGIPLPAAPVVPRRRIVPVNRNTLVTAKGKPILRSKGEMKEAGRRTVFNSETRKHEADIASMQSAATAEARYSLGSIRGYERVHALTPTMRTQLSMDMVNDASARIDALVVRMENIDTAFAHPPGQSTLPGYNVESGPINDKK